VETGALAKVVAELLVSPHERLQDEACDIQIRWHADQLTSPGARAVLQQRPWKLSCPEGPVPQYTKPETPSDLE